MIIAKLCRECVGIVTGHCDGKDVADTKSGQKPCKNYMFDMSMVAESDIEPDSKPPSLKDRKPEVVRPLVPDAVLPTNKVKAANFTRLAVKRLSTLLDGFRKLSNLSNKATYEWDLDQIDVIVGRLRSATENLSKKFQK